MSAERRFWEVVGGADKGGILVREGQSLKSAACPDRLSTGAKVLELAEQGGRVNYQLLTGTGPKEGWVNIKLVDKDLLVSCEDPGGLEPEEEEKEEEGEELVAGEVPWHLRPACEVAAPGLKPVQILGPFLPAANMKDAKTRAKLRLKGDMYGLPIPLTPQEFESPEYGAAWLTKAFHAAGSLAEDNSVKRIASAKNFPGGGSGPKTLFTVEYEKPDESLDTTLFMKLPAEVGATGSGVSTAAQRAQDMQGVFGDIWGAEIQFYRFVGPHVPYPVPKFYFGDQSRESQEAVVITSAVDWPKKGKKSFKAFQVLPPCEKCEDYTLTDSQDFYFALLRRLGTISGLERTGKLGPEIASIHWSQYGPNMRGMAEGMTQFFRTFVTEVAPQIWPEKVRSSKWLDDFTQAMDLVQKVSVPMEQYLYANPLYVGFGHQNGNTDNAYFYRGADGTLECGLFDWGSAGRMSYAQEFIGSFGSCLGEMLADYDDKLMHCFADAYHATGAEPFDVEELILQYRLAMLSNTCQMLGMTMPYLSEKHPQGRPFWKNIKSYKDEQIRSVFALKFGVSMLYNKVVLMSLRLDTYWESLMIWVKRMGW